MTDAITRKHQIISTGFLNKIKFPSGYDGDRKKKIDSGDLVELLVDNCSPRLTYNLLTLEPEFDGQTIQIDFVESFSTYLNMYGYNIRKDSAFDGLLTAARQNTYHPVNAYLERIADNKSIKPIDIETMSSEYLGTDSNLYNQMLKMTLIAAVARVIDRGCKFDNCCVLVGKQGTGKSTFWRYLASDAFFTDTWQPKLQDLAMILQNYLRQVS